MSGWSAAIRLARRKFCPSRKPHESLRLGTGTETKLPAKDENEEMRRWGKMKRACLRGAVCDARFYTAKSNAA
ncbi:MAG: hypothetical protein QXP42_04220 [Candidatus Micrarchaeia archaeon]